MTGCAGNARPVAVSGVLMNLSFITYTPDQSAQLIDFISGEPWPMFVNANPSREMIQGWIDEGMYSAPENLIFWIMLDGQRVGIIRAHDVPKWTGLDFRISAAYRGRGIGTAALRWITAHLFETQPEILRLEGQTRQDNTAMRAVFRRCGYVKEAHYRRAWPNQDGPPLDGIGYSMLREDWQRGTTTPVDWHDE